MEQQPPELKALLRRDLTESIRARDALRTGTLRMALTAITNAEVAGRQHHQLGEAETLAVVAKEAKKRKEASAAYAQAGRPELAEVEDAEYVVLQRYLPAQLDDSELDALAAAAVQQLGASGMAQMGQVMKVVQPQVAGRAEGGRVATAVRRALSGRQDG
ncbi:MAG: GatB/YqeY domain-containing protein [Ornithinimicrobium sp.]